MKPIPHRRLWAGLALLILLTPVGLMLPESFQAQGAWGEWGAEELRTLLGYVPARLGQLDKFWRALLPGYAIPGMDKPWQTRLAYIGSGVLGAGVILAVALYLGKRLTADDEQKRRSIL